MVKAKKVPCDWKQNNKSFSRYLLDLYYSETADLIFLLEKKNEHISPVAWLTWRFLIIICNDVILCSFLWRVPLIPEDIE